MYFFIPLRCSSTKRCQLRSPPPTVQLLSSPTYRTFTFSVTYTRGSYSKSYWITKQEKKKKMLPHTIEVARSLDFCSSQFMQLIVCGWIVMEKKISPIHWTITEQLHPATATYTFNLEFLSDYAVQLLTYGVTTVRQQD